MFEKVLSNRDVALVMVEAAGAFSGVIGITPAFYKAMRELTTQYGTLLHFDEIVTGFRYSPGGVQAAKKITPDLTSLGKILTGGMPGAGVIVGRDEVMDMLSFKDDDWNRYKRVSHTGTFNGNPLCSAAGIATLQLIAGGEPQEKANRMAEELRKRMEQAIVERGIAGCVFGDFSVFHVYLGDCALRDECDRRICLNADKERPPEIGRRLAINAILNGVHLPNRGYDGLVSAVHTESDIDKTAQAFGTSLDMLIQEGALST